MDVIPFPVNLYITSGLSILLHGVISLPDATSYDKCNFVIMEVVWLSFRKFRGRLLWNESSSRSYIYIVCLTY